MARGQELSNLGILELGDGAWLRLERDADPSRLFHDRVHLLLELFLCLFKTVQS